MDREPFQFGLGGLLAFTGGVAVLTALAANGGLAFLGALACVSVIPILIGQSIVFMLDVFDWLRAK
jgi:hypothetical protein